ncbi:acyltransferase family protein [Burkholderia ubonensis]|uniref:acyltransferase family protein n=1 Tax=Burkholderia ubonensis TaxID=101571 RepID=UPI00075E93AD|nr:acyltransferase [Burkholderia ubonensis]KWC56582.1 hypothetical protein WL53_16560 [Burkholderia ubonensis]
MQSKNQEIEALRAAAVIITCLNHLVLLFRWTPNPLGRLSDYLQFWGGVDLFFCISGYIVSKSFVEALDTAHANEKQWQTIKAFWVRRAYRLMPSAWLWLAIGLICSIYFNKTGIFGTPAEAIRSSIAVLSFTANLSQYFGLPMHPNGVYWSLALEEQFYLVFPFFILLTPVAWRWKVLLAAIALQFPLVRATIVDFSWYVRLDALMWGIVIYIFSRTSEYRIFEPTSLRNRPVASLASLALIGGIMVIPSALAMVPFHVGLMAIASAILVFMASFDRGYILPIRALSPILSYIGSRSYAIYLSHLPAFMLTHEIWSNWATSKGLPAPNGTYTIRYAITALALVAVFSELNYRLVETPLRRKGARLAAIIANKEISGARPA